jgi:CheY-like chemotaxis protein
LIHDGIQSMRRRPGIRRVLVIDNEATILDGMRALLESWGCVVLTALNAEEARAALAESDIDLILADYHLAQGATGDAEVAALRLQLGRSVPAAIITADRMPELREQLLAAGLHVLQKPVKPAQLRALMARLVN